MCILFTNLLPHSIPFTLPECKKRIVTTTQEGGRNDDSLLFPEAGVSFPRLICDDDSTVCGGHVLLACDVWIVHVYWNGEIHFYWQQRDEIHFCSSLTYHQYSAEYHLHVFGLLWLFSCVSFREGDVAHIHTVNVSSSYSIVETVFSVSDLQQ